MDMDSSMTTMPPAPGDAPLSSSPPGTSGTSIPPGGSNVPDGPPHRTARISLPGTGPPAHTSITWRSAVPNGTSYTPGARTAPDTHTSFVPGNSGVPHPPNASAPSVTISGRLQSVSTLLMTVGRPHSPASTGNGGR